MERYKNLGGDSSVFGYEIDTNLITVYFTDQSAYVYTYQSAGPVIIEKMKSLAIAGRGLNSYIMTYAKTKYASKFRYNH